MYKRILIPVDFTDKNLAALDQVYQLAKWGHGSVTLLHVIEKVENIPAKELKQFYQTLEKNARTRMSQYAKTFAKHSVPVTEKIVYGKRAEEIVRCALDEDIELIVVSSHKVEAPRGWSTLSYQVAIFSPCPVLLVK
jgi:nucleotide-binding universal stress UspA family protein